MKILTFLGEAKSELPACTIVHLAQGVFDLLFGAPTVLDNQSCMRSYTASFICVHHAGT
jgi:hypothetical protein